MRIYRVELMAAMLVRSTTEVRAILPFKAAEHVAGQPVTLRRNEQDWIRVTELTGQQRSFAYVVRG